MLADSEAQSSFTRSEHLQTSTQQIVDERLKKLQKCEFINGVHNLPGDTELDNGSEKEKVYK